MGIEALADMEMEGPDLWSHLKVRFLVDQMGMSAGYGSGPIGFGFRTSSNFLGEGRRWPRQRGPVAFSSSEVGKVGGV